MSARGASSAARWFGATVLVSVLAAGLVACGGGGSENTSGTAPAGIEGVPEGAPFIDQDGLDFSPGELTVAAGEKVYFKNSESAIHTVTIEDENVSGTMERDDIFAWQPPGPGEFEVTCDFHPQMRATITVN